LKAAAQRGGQLAVVQHLDLAALANPIGEAEVFFVHEAR
jgi:hypothetical protein